MPPSFTRRETLIALGGTAVTALAVPTPAMAGEPALDAPFVPTPHSLVEKMLALAEVGAADYLIDLGCGDGRIAVAAARRGARSLGVDLDALRIREAAAAARIAGVEARARFRRQDLFETPLFEASVVALYLLPELNLRLRPKLLTELHPGARIVSHAFDMGDWRPDETQVHDGRHIFLWRVPAVADGDWVLTDGNGREMMLELEQHFQEVSGKLIRADRELPVQEGSLRGAVLSFTVVSDTAAERFDLVIDGATMSSVPGQPGGLQGRRL